jgi:hypothetical protein
MVAGFGTVPGSGAMLLTVHGPSPHFTPWGVGSGATLLAGHAPSPHLTASGWVTPSPHAASTATPSAAIHLVCPRIVVLLAGVRKGSTAPSG